MTNKVTYTFKSPTPYKQNKEVVAKPFKLESPKQCYVCKSVLRAEETEHKSTFTYYDKDNKVIGTLETYVCFDCIENLIGRRPNHE